MELNTNVYVQLAAAGEEYAIQNKDTHKNAILLIVKSDSTTPPTFNAATNADAFEVNLGEGLTSSNLEGPIWGAPLNKSVKFAMQKW